MSWIVIRYFLNLRPLDTLHPFFYRTVEFKPSPSAFNGPFLFTPANPAFRARCFGPVNRSRSCLKSVIRE
ncbi:hypothetical protein PS645_05399 [Pseudomonas fluorescens]|uniref:Uncharacterized protein n=1 Tax=Pseudomonas fluorescens TaxID=294 RepID=A0A5E6XIF0_PSEFL|nr:hypothetical protein PS645_02233 [Pseudomonas fluorescens]VVN23425.1 hypothetical protein PS645_04439 [Pseudomonas fluorescens]VVN40910.1 hypothetical protein PS645_05399 [Pseudomonas fluorescens]